MTAENWKQLYSSTEEWINKLWFSYIMKEGIAVEMVLLWVRG